MTCLTSPTTTTGARYSSDVHDAAVIARAIRTDIKAAVTAGRLPSRLTYAVRTSKYSMGQSIAITVSGMTDDEQWTSTEPDGRGWRDRWTPEAAAVTAMLDELGNAYNRREFDAHTDYANVAYWCSIRIMSDREQEYEAREASARAAKRAARAAR